MKKAGRSGYTLLEVIISMMLTAILCSAVFSIAITAQQSSNKIDRRVIANQCQRHLSEMLANYVSGDYSATNDRIAGPTSTTPGVASWYINGATGEDGRVIVDSCGACYALSPGVHTLTNFLPGWFEVQPFNGAISYTITNTALTNGNQPNVSISVTWTEP
ncbi:MAG: type II secretion system protein [Elusimicrobia bacterium]|nr:type II secretion system protein [Elusimicrobiota bacterium]